MKKILIASFGLMMASAAHAQQPEAQAPLSARVDNPRVRAKYELRRQTPPVVIAPRTREVLPDTRTTSVWILEMVLDRGVLVSFEIPKGSEASLEATAAVHVQRAEDVGHNTIWGGKYFRLMPLHESALDDDALQKFVGMPMKFDVAMRSDGRLVVLDIRRP